MGQRLSRTRGAQLQQPEPDAGSSGDLSPKELCLPTRAHFACLAKLLMSGKGYFFHLTLIQPCHLGPAQSLLKEPEQFLEYGLLQFKLISQQDGSCEV